MNMTKEENKKAFRKHSIERLRYGAKRYYYKDKKVILELYKLLKESKSKEILLYLPLGMEANIYPLIQRLRKEGVNLYVPFMEGKSFRVVKYRLPLHKKQFGIKEPNDSKQYKVKKLDIAIVPIIGIDATHRRIGFGKGMYDRYFEKNHKNIKKVVFVARELCYSQEIVTDNYDIKADILIVP
jgi:5-formyltetrahydrofolate cyclo-ligase